ncbi:hypothetical protein DFQ27_002237 [Actinomortierella ambigua]|uniref:Uncharacterized protein n=1 Tax=Actinomortierella ambigua TaxID=1343610 RepID=A0A9P6QCH9_9FUNG|nr:hypothetical protein DFQ27_002237 [Actinomortierella ambigua]
MRHNRLFALATAVMLISAHPSSASSECRILSDSSSCASIQYLTSVDSVEAAEARIQSVFDKLPGSMDILQAPCLAALQEALCLLEFPKDYVARTCYESFTHPRLAADQLKVENGIGGDDTPTITLDQIRVSLFGHQYDKRWAPAASVQEPECVSFSDHGLGTSHVEKMGHVLDDVQTSAKSESKKVLGRPSKDAKAYVLEAHRDQQNAFLAVAPTPDEAQQENQMNKIPVVADVDEHDWLEDDSVDMESGEGSYKRALNADKIAEVAGEVAQEMLEDQQHKVEPKMLNRRERAIARHHHHHQTSSKNNNNIQLVAQDEPRHHEHVATQKAPRHHDHLVARKKPQYHDHHNHEKRQDPSNVGTPAGQDTLMHDQPALIEHATEEKPPVGSVVQEVASAPASENQRVLAQAGSSDVKGDPSKEEASLNSGGDTQATAEGAPPQGPKKNTLLLAVVPVVLLIAAIAGFTAYRRHYENPFNQGGRNDTRDGIPTDDDYHRRDVPLRKGSPIHFDRTFINAMHSPPPAATYLHDPDFHQSNNNSNGHHHSHHHHPYRSHSNSRNHSPTSPAATAAAMTRPPPSAGSLGKSRFQELNRSHDFGAGFRAIRQAFSRSRNASKEAGINHGPGAHSSASLHEAGGASSAATAAHESLYPGTVPGSNYALGVHRGASGGGSSHTSGSTNATSSVALGKQRAMGSSPRSHRSDRLYGSTVDISSSSHHDIQSMAGPSTTQEHAIIWGQYSATDDDPSFDPTAQSLAAHLAKRSVSSNSLSLLASSGLFGGGGNATSKYTHHQPCIAPATSQASLSMVAGQSPYASSHALNGGGGGGGGAGVCPQSPADSIGNCLSPSDSPPMSREEHMRRQSLMNSQYAFDSDEADSYTSRDLLFDARDHLQYDEKTGLPITIPPHRPPHHHRSSHDPSQQQRLDQQRKHSQSFLDRLRPKKAKDQAVPEIIGATAGATAAAAAAAAAAADDEEMDMYLRMEKEISPMEDAVFDILKDDGSHPRDASLIVQKSVPTSRAKPVFIDEKSEIRAMAATTVTPADAIIVDEGDKYDVKMEQGEEVWNEKVGLETDPPKFPVVDEGKDDDDNDNEQDKLPIEDDAVVPVAAAVATATAAEETHVLGSASPASSLSSNKDSVRLPSHAETRYETAIPVIPTAEPNHHKLLSGLGNAEAEGDEEEEEVPAMEEDYGFDRDEWEENPKVPDQTQQVPKASGSHGSSTSLNKKKKKPKKNGRKK